MCLTRYLLCRAITAEQSLAKMPTDLWAYLRPERPALACGGAALLVSTFSNAFAPRAMGRVVDAYALTREQCWATQRDGVHYLPLLPSRLSALTAHVVDCLREQRPPFRGFRSPRSSEHT